MLKPVTEKMVFLWRLAVASVDVHLVSETMFVEQEQNKKEAWKATPDPRGPVRAELSLDGALKSLM